MLELRLRELMQWAQMISLQPVGTCLNDIRVYEATLRAGQSGRAQARESQATPAANAFHDPQVYMGAKTSSIHSAAADECQ